MYSMYFDGSSNKKGIGFACIIKDENNEVVIRKNHRIEHKDLTSNSAEYLALILGLLTALENGILELQVYGDSLLIINQVNQKYSVKSPHLQAYYFIVKSLVRNFEYVSFTWIDRKNNKEVDRISR